MAMLLDLGEGALPTLATLCPPPEVCPPDFLPGSFSGYHRGQDSSSHLSPSAAVVLTHPFALLFGGCC